MEHFERNERIWLYAQLGMPKSHIGKKFDLSGQQIAAILSKRQRLTDRYVNPAAADVTFAVSALVDGYYDKTAAAARIIGMLSKIVVDKES